MGGFGGRGGDWTQGGTSWTVDYPKGDRTFIRLLKRLSLIDVRSVEQPVNLDDGDDVFDWPFLIVGMPGSWDLTDAQAAKLREYLLRGGYLLCDSFFGTNEWAGFEAGLKRIFPDRPVIDLPTIIVFHRVTSVNAAGRQLPLAMGYGYERPIAMMVQFRIGGCGGRCRPRDGGDCVQQRPGCSWQLADEPQYHKKIPAWYPSGCELRCVCLSLISGAQTWAKICNLKTVNKIVAHNAKNMPFVAQRLRNTLNSAGSPLKKSLSLVKSEACHAQKRHARRQTGRVSTDLSRMVAADGIAPNLLGALENWQQLNRIAAAVHDLNAGRSADALSFDVTQAAAPLPRAPQWLDASAYQSHGDLLEKVFNMEPPAHKREIPLMYQGASDDLLGPREDVLLPSEADGIDFEAEVGVIVDDVPMGITAADATAHIKLLVLINDVSLRALAFKDIKTGFGFLQAKPSTSFSPVAVTPDELGSAWSRGQVNLPVQVYWNEREFGHPHAGAMGFSFEELIAHGARTRRLSAGTVLGSAPSPTITTVKWARAVSPSAWHREEDLGEVRTPYMKFGDRVRIDMLDAAGRSIFGAIDQRMVQKTYP
jgi:fumarylacetoacetate (FAA) hydrolase